MANILPPNFRGLLAHQASLPDAEVDLQRAALLLSGEEFPELDVEGYLARLDTMADEARSLAGNAVDRAGLARGLNRFLFDQQGFVGNSADYYSPANSFLNVVMDTRVGIPITLSVLYLGIAKRMGLSCCGVGMPGHFLVYLEDLDLYMDPFHSGELLSAGDCRRLAQGLFGPSLEWSDGFLAPCPSKLILARMLNNLRHIYAHHGDSRKLAAVLERMLLFDRTSSSLYGELARCQIRMGQGASAIRSLEQLILHSGSQREIASARRMIDELREPTGPVD